MRKRMFATVAAAMASLAASAAEGAQCLLDVPGSFDSAYVSPKLALDKAAETTSYYRLTFEAKSPVDGYWWVDFHDKTNALLPDVNSRLYASEDFIPYDVVVPASPEAVTAVVKFELKKPNVAQVRDLKMRRISVDDACVWCTRTYAAGPQLGPVDTAGSWDLLPKARKALTEGKGRFDVVLLGDSLMNDSYCGLLGVQMQKAFPNADLRIHVSVRGSTGCWYYREKDHFEECVAKYRPDLVLIGGVSNCQTNRFERYKADRGLVEEDMVETIERCKAIGAEVVVCTPPKSVEFRKSPEPKELPADFNDEASAPDFLQLAFERRAAQRTGVQLWDLNGPTCGAVARSGKPLGWFNRDFVHNDDRGKQLIGQTFAAYFRAALREAQPATYFVSTGETGTASEAGAARANAAVRRRVAFLGGSITAMTEGYRPRVAAWLRKTYPNVRFDVTSAGISSTCSDTGAFRLQEHVLDPGVPDLLIFEYAVNDDQDGHFTREHMVRGMEGIVRRLRKANPAAEMVIVLFVNDRQIEEIRRSVEPLAYSAHREVAAHYGIPVADVGGALFASERAGTYGWKEYGSCHPSPEGCELAARTIEEVLKNSWSPYRLPAEKPMPPPMDANCYECGGTLPLESAKLGAGWNLSLPDWDKVKGFKRPLYVQKPVLWSETAGAEMRIPFEGRALGIFLTAGPDAGALDVSVDGGPFVRHDLYTGYSSGLNYPYTRILADDLAAGRHEVVVRVASESNPASTGRAVRINHLVVNGNGEREGRWRK